MNTPSFLEFGNKAVLDRKHLYLVLFLRNDMYSELSGFFEI